MFLKCIKFVLVISLLPAELLFPAFSDAKTTSDTGSSTAPAPVCPTSNPASQTETEDGNYLGTTRNGGLTYRFEDVESHTLNISVDVKTRQQDGIIFYVAGVDKTDFFAIFLNNSKLHAAYSCDGSVNSYSAGVTVNDGAWHRIQLRSVENRTQLTIDETYIGRTSGCKKINVKSPYYIGAVESDVLPNAKVHLEGLDTALVGCVRNMTSRGKNLRASSESPGVTCPVSVESGAYFSAEMCYFAVEKQFSADEGIEIKMEIKPRNGSGLLAMLHSKSKYVILMLEDGVVKFSAERGSGWASTSAPLSSPTHSCDSRWHKINAYLRKNVLLLTVDSRTSPPTVDMGASLKISTSGPLYIGGYPVTGTMGFQLETKSQYVGCIRNIEIDGQKMNLFSMVPHGPITFNQCPTV